MAPPSLKDVAERSGVSSMTVSRVVTGRGDVSEATRRRVEAAIAELGYRPHYGARSLRTGRTQTLRLILYKHTERLLANPFLDDVVAGTVDTAARIGYAVLIEVARIEDPNGMPPGYADRQVDGAILLDSHVDLPLGPVLRASGVPSVVVANRDLDPDLGLGWIDADFQGGAELLMQHLLDLGHRRIVHIADNPTLRSSIGRRAGYEAALRASGIEPLATDVVQAGQMRSHGYAATQWLLENTAPFTAVFAVNDLTAFGAIDCLRDRGLRVPEDVSVTGYDDIDMAQYATPSLTTARLPWYEMSAAAVEMVIGAIEGTGAFPQERVFAVSTHIRGSTAAAPLRR